MPPRITRFQPTVSWRQFDQFHYLTQELELLGSELLREMIKRLAFLVKKQRDGYEISHQKNGQKEILDVLSYDRPELIAHHNRLQFNISGIVHSALLYIQKELRITQTEVCRQAIKIQDLLLKKKKKGWKLVLQKGDEKETIIFL